jgi:hypothetical protein
LFNDKWQITLEFICDVCQRERKQPIGRYLC